LASFCGEIDEIVIKVFPGVDLIVAVRLYVVDGRKRPVPEKLMSVLVFAVDAIPWISSAYASVLRNELLDFIRFGASFVFIVLVVDDIESAL
jgi:hypothetical protein